MDLKKLLNGSRKELYQVVAVIICAVSCLWLYSCESAVPSLKDPRRTVTRDELQVELNNYLDLAEVRFRNLDRQDDFKRALVENAVIVSNTGQVNIQGILNTIFAVLGIGAITDNVRKRRVIKRLNGANPVNA